jgi:VWFA-related protein
VSDVARIAGILLLFLVAQTPQTPSQSPQPAQPRFRGGTNLVRVDAFATKGGVPVQDLTAADIEVFEDGAPQKIDAFEHIVIGTPGPEASRIDPTSPTEANRLVADPHRRVFVVYLDIEHVDVTGSHNIKEPLIELLNRIVGDDDLVGVMTPVMSPDQIAFTRRTQVIEDGLRNNWAWGRRDSILPDAREQLYQNCFPPLTGETSPSALARALTNRRRERMVLESLHDLVRHMEAIREGRTAVITVSDGWLLYRPDQTLTNLRVDPMTGAKDPVPGGPPPVGVGPGGKLTKRPTNDPDNADRTECERDQMELAMMDNSTYFRDIFGEANRANVAFYTIDPRGLVVFDSPIGPDRPPSPLQDLVNLRDRHDSLHTLAINTDGIALTESNDLRNQLRKIADDLTSYYLIGYYSSNAKLDGRYRTIKVRSKRPGVEIRARQGYRAASAAEANAAQKAASLPVSAEKQALTRALGSIESDARAYGRPTTRGAGEPLIFHRGPQTGNQVLPAPGRVFPRSERLHLEFEAAADTPGWTGAVLDRNGGKTPVPVAVGERTDAASGQRWLTADLTLAPLGAGDYVVELTTTVGTEQKRTLVAIRVTP